MYKIFKISLLISLFGFGAAEFSSTQAAAVQISVNSDVDRSDNQEPSSTIYGNPVLPIFFAELLTDSNWESDPDSSFLLNPGREDLQKVDGELYLRLQKQIDHSQSIRELIYPFHSHL